MVTKKSKEEMTKIAKEIYEVLSREKCTLGQANEIIRQVECVLSVAPTVQKNECSEKMFTQLGEE